MSFTILSLEGRYRSLGKLLELLFEPVFGEIIELTDLKDSRQVCLSLECIFGTGIKHLQRHLTVSGSVVDEAHWIGDPTVLMDHLIRVDDVSWLMAWQRFLQFLDGNIVQELI